MYWKLPCDLEKVVSCPCCHFGMFCSHYSAAFLQPGEDTLYSLDPLIIPFADLFRAKVFGNQKESFNCLISQTDGLFVPMVHKKVVSSFLYWVGYSSLKVLSFGTLLLIQNNMKRHFVSFATKTVTATTFPHLAFPPNTITPLCLDSVSAAFVCITILHN